jgi:hypothetical protein
MLQREELVVTRQQLKESSDAQREMAMHQNHAISLQVILPMMEEIGSKDMRRSIIQISDFKRHHGGDVNFVQHYALFLEKRRLNTLSLADSTEFQDINAARRRFIMIFHKLHKLNKIGVIDDDIVKVVIGPDTADLLLETVEKLEAAIRTNYSREVYDFTRRLYTEAELLEMGRY